MPLFVCQGIFPALTNEKRHGDNRAIGVGTDAGAANVPERGSPCREGPPTHALQRESDIFGCSVHVWKRLGLPVRVRVGVLGPSLEAPRSHPDCAIISMSLFLCQGGKDALTKEKRHEVRKKSGWVRGEWVQRSDIHLGPGLSWGRGPLRFSSRLGRVWAGGRSGSVRVWAESGPGAARVQFVSGSGLGRGPRGSGSRCGQAWVGSLGSCSRRGRAGAGVSSRLSRVGGQGAWSV
jgi:hypothetical protein